MPGYGLRVMPRISVAARACASRVTHSEVQAGAKVVGELIPQMAYTARRKPAWQMLRATYAVKKGSFREFPLKNRRDSTISCARVLQAHNHRT
jgi:hypothetical protein